MATIFDITTKTGDKDGMGTNANIYITLHGENGVNSDEVLIDTPDHDDKEAGDTDSYRISVSQNNLGPIKSITLRNDDSGDGPGWWCEWVRVSSNGKQGYFPWNNWIASDEDPGLIVLVNREGAWA